MQFKKGFTGLAIIWSITPFSTNMASERVTFWGVFILFKFSIFWGRFNKTNIPLALVGYEMVDSQRGAYLICASGIIVKYF